VRSMLRTAKPNGLDPKYQRTYAKYFSRFMSAYKAHGIPAAAKCPAVPAHARDEQSERSSPNAHGQRAREPGCGTARLYTLVIALGWSCGLVHCPKQSRALGSQ